MEVQSMEPMYLSIQPEETGERIRRLLLEQGYTIREIQGAFGFENPQAIYKWLSGKSLPSIDNFIILIDYCILRLKISSSLTGYSSFMGNFKPMVEWHPLPYDLQSDQK